MFWAIVFVTAVVFGIAGAVILDPFDKFGAGFALGFFLGPIGVVIAFAMRTNAIDSGATRNGYRKCPACAETVKLEATKCRYCGELLVAAPQGGVATQPPYPAAPEADARWSKAIVWTVAVILVASIIGSFISEHGNSNASAYVPPRGTAYAFPVAPYDTEHIIATVGRPVSRAPRNESARGVRVAPTGAAKSAVDSASYAVAVAVANETRARDAYAANAQQAIDYAAADSKPLFLSGAGGNGHLPLAPGLAGGSVTVHFVVIADGSVGGAIGESTNGDALRSAVVFAVMTRRYTPGQRGGEPIATRMSQVISIP